MDIFLLRHAETKSNEQGALSSSADDVLTEYGLAQADSIVSELENLKIKSILSSPYPRALQTVAPFAQASGLKVQVHSCLAEGQLVLDHLTRTEEPRYERSSSYPVYNETKEQFIGRARQAANLLLNRLESRILVVTHGHMIRELINIFINSSSKVRFPHDNCGLTYISFGENVAIEYLNRKISSNKPLHSELINQSSFLQSQKSRQLSQSGE